MAGATGAFVLAPAEAQTGSLHHDCLLDALETYQNSTHRVTNSMQETGEKLGLDYGIQLGQMLMMQAGHIMYFQVELCNSLFS